MNIKETDIEALVDEISEKLAEQHEFYQHSDDLSRHILEYLNQGYIDASEIAEEILTNYPPSVIYC